MWPKYNIAQSFCNSCIARNFKYFFEHRNLQTKHTESATLFGETGSCGDSFVFKHVFLKRIRSNHYTRILTTPPPNT